MDAPDKPGHDDKGGPRVARFQEPGYDELLQSET
jgi:hypothetical protein